MTSPTSTAGRVGVLAAGASAALAMTLSAVVTPVPAQAVVPAAAEVPARAAAGWRLVGAWDVAAWSPRLAVSPTGDVWVSQPYPGRLVRYSAAGAQLASFPAPSGVAPAMDVDAAGNVHLVGWNDEATDAVQVLSPGGAVVRSYAPFGPAGGPHGDVDLDPTDIGLDPAGNAFLVESDLRAGWHDEFLAKYDATGHRLWKRGSTTAGGIMAEQTEVVAGAGGTSYVASPAADRIVVHDASGNVAGGFGQLGGEPGRFSTPVGLAFSPSGTIAVVDGTDRVQEFAADGTYLATLVTPHGDNDDVDFSADGSTMYVLGDGQVLRYQRTGGAGVVGKKVKAAGKKATLKLTCPATAVSGCVGKARLQQKVRKGRKKVEVTVARGAYALPAGASAKVKVRLTKAGRAALRGRRVVKVTITLSPQVGGQPVTVKGKLVRRKR
ncbi:hypothetical protein [Nocardioides humi]|uniref:NHL repeat-containing protein n=1 Tax=Nocardioides humi TaxID=449461 RepID=A0ABN1ZTB5_9ACTN|nr:hypothetical protein [Nocardioides humi]